MKKVFTIIDQQDNEVEFNSNDEVVSYLKNRFGDVVIERMSPEMSHDEIHSVFRHGEERKENEDCSIATLRIDHFNTPETPHEI